MDSLQDIASGSHPRRSPRILELARLRELEKDSETQSQQRDAHLQKRRLLYRLKHDSMTEVERKALLEKHHSAYRNRKTPYYHSISAEDLKWEPKTTSK
ncbi:hypothetical protein MKX03_023055 [Papaver bracteatum]|nr:hypothetical protein MKX03_023055 [Papaver bracteatum]